MSEAIERMLVSVRLLWVLALIRLCLFCSLGLGAAYLGSMSEREWDSLKPSTKFQMKVAWSMGTVGTVLAFLDKTSHQLARGEILPPDIGATTTIHRHSTVKVKDKPTETSESTETTVTTTPKK